jgi:hypothetical protein
VRFISTSQILKLAGAVQDLSAPTWHLLSFHLAGSLPLDLDFKQKLLAQRSESKRISRLAEYFETPTFPARVREKAAQRMPARKRIRQRARVETQPGAYNPRKYFPRGFFS